MQYYVHSICIYNIYNYTQDKSEKYIYIYIVGRRRSGASNICSHTLICYTVIHKSIYIGLSVNIIE